MLTIPAGCEAKKGRCRSCGNVVQLDALDPGGTISAEDVMSWLADEEGGQTARAPRAVALTGGGGPAVKKPPAAVRAGAGGSRTTMRSAQRSGSRPTFKIALEHVDDMGAFFVFGSRLLQDPDFRASFPQKCITCGSTDSLQVHLIEWVAKRGRANAPKATGEHRSHVFELSRFGGISRRDLLGKLGRMELLPEPYCFPFPYYVCRCCSAVGAVVTDVRPSAGGVGETCELGIASLAQAAEFAAATLGSGNQDAKRLREGARKDAAHAWKLLPLAVRNRIGQWYKKQPGESFIAYIPDADFSAAEAGKAGAVITDQRMLCHKLISVTEFPLTERIRIQAKGAGDPQKLILTSSKGAKTTKAAFTANQASADQLRSLIDRHGAHGYRPPGRR